MKEIKKIILSGMPVWPIIEGGKGIGVSNGDTAGAFAAAGAVGTISGVCPPMFDVSGKMIPTIFSGQTRFERHKETILHSIEGSIREIKKAYKISEGKGRLHLNVLWGVAGAEEIIESVLSETKGMLHGITCGAGMPYRLGAVAKKFNVYYYPIVSSARAFSALWSRAYKEVADYLGGIVYEDPWKAGGHNGLSNKENPLVPESAYERVSLIRETIKKQGLVDTPIIMAGGVWNLQQYEDWLDNAEIGPVAFQIGTRSLLTKESPISEQWKQKLASLKKGDIILNNYSSTGFYSSAIKNEFLTELEERSGRQIPFSTEETEAFSVPFEKKGTEQLYISEESKGKAQQWIMEGYTKPLITPESTAVFVTKEKASEIKKDQRDCKGCLVACKFSSWSIDPTRNYTTGIPADPRSFCIFKTLQNIVCGSDMEKELAFSGHNSYKFALDPMYSNGYVPSIKELIQQMLQGK
ncbi:MAG: nitronate monooxygenase [Cytophagaceae bacterium]